MKKAVIILIIFAVITGSCKVQKSPATHEKGVVINGIKWATRNVDEFGTFAPTPESEGKIYQWNRKIAWNTTDKAVDWDYSLPEDKKWTKANDPSPAGWRVPTFDEIKTLLDTTKVEYKWVVQNSVRGGKFTDKRNGNSIFLPAVGTRDCNDSKLKNETLDGNYWSSTPKLRIPSYYQHYYYLLFDYFDRNEGAKYRSNVGNNGFSVRSVAK
ncbi:MAG: fibrobacter succinogenes major paralogous domain-containing protein [Candidatus Azobacteroides sp.]|nr:fibrobacter succinogenes major paralogous domain-containing protein [Candidatus Azobacteroides sp.]